MINYLHPAIDSLTIRIPSSHYNLIDAFPDVYIVRQQSGDIVDTTQLRKHQIDVGNAHIYLRLMRYPDGSEWLSIALSSKLLEVDYLKGLLYDDIRHIMRKLIPYLKRSNLVEILPNWWQVAKVIDVDIKLDIQIDLDVHRFLSDVVNFEMLPRIYQSRGKIYAVQYGYRAQRATKTPYFKFYDKLKELRSRSKDWFSAVNPVLPAGNIIRIEMNIKNNRAFEQHFGITNDLIDLKHLHPIVIQERILHVVAPVYNSKRINISAIVESSKNQLDLSLYNKFWLAFVVANQRQRFENEYVMDINTIIQEGSQFFPYTKKGRSQFRLWKHRILKRFDDYLSALDIK